MFSSEMNVTHGLPHVVVDFEKLENKTLKI